MDVQRKQDATKGVLVVVELSHEGCSLRR